MHVYEVMNGILMSYDVLDMKSCWQDTPPVPGVIQINYCNEGCFEFELETGEIGFLSNPKEEELIASPDFQKAVAKAISDGLIAYFAG